MKRQFATALIAVVCCSTADGSCPPESPKRLGWITLDDLVVINLFPNSNDDYLFSQVAVESAGGFLVPQSPGWVDSIIVNNVFSLGGTENRIIFAAVPIVGLDDSVLQLSAQYELEAALQAGVDPSNDLRLWHECGDETYSYPATTPGDTNFDLSVDFDDFLELSSNYAREDAVWKDGDFDWDRSVGFSDFLILRDNFGQGSQAASVPEPTGKPWVLTVTLGLLLSFRRRKRIALAASLESGFPGSRPQISV